MSFTCELWQLQKRGHPYHVMEIKEEVLLKMVATSKFVQGKTLSLSGSVLAGKDGDAATCNVCGVRFLLLQINKTAVKK